MKLIDIFHSALNSLRSNLLRSILTMLIVAIGISSLVGILTAIDSIIYSQAESMSTLGTNSLKIEPLDNDRSRHGGKRSKRRKVITYKEATAFKKDYKFPADVSISFPASRSVVIKYSDKKTHPNIMLFGVDENELKIYKTELSYGRFFTQKEIESGVPFIIIGKNIVKKIFDDIPLNALDKIVLVNNIKYKVIGIIKEAGQSSSQNNDNKVFVPIMNLKGRYGTKNTNYGIAIKFDDASLIAKGEQAAIMTFRNIRKLNISEENNFQFVKSNGMIEVMQDNMAALKGGGLFISSITLIGAAIALMNIMLVSVTDRIKEIGITKALGATKGNIRKQYLMEALIICETGGLLGILLGVLLGFAMNAFLGGVFRMPWTWIFIAIITTTIVGIFSGIYPAIKASSLDPVESLRHE